MPEKPMNEKEKAGKFADKDFGLESKIIEKKPEKDKPPMQYKLVMPEFIKPTPTRTLIFSFLAVLAVIAFLFLILSVLSNRQVSVSVFLLGKDLFYIIVFFLLQGAILLNAYFPFLQFSSYYSLLLIIIAFAVELAYLWLLSCIISNFVEKKEWALGAIIALVMVIAFIITPAKTAYDDLYPKAECLYPIIKSGMCYAPDGAWNSAPRNLGAEKYGIPLKCLADGGALDKTTWQYDSQNFNCGRPPA